MYQEETITEYLKRHREEEVASFHTPGHKGRSLFCGHDENCKFPNIEDDITEIEGADNLFDANGIILSCMNQYKELYGARNSYILVNGSSAGIMAAITSAVHEDEEIIIARNSHKSVFNAVKLCGGIPKYVFSEMDSEFGIPSKINPEELSQLILETPDAKAVVITSPNYYGVCSDIRKISEITHREGMILIVDQAHGAHIKFLNPEKDAGMSGADVVVMSTHKTLASLTQSAVVNIYSERIDVDLFEKKLEMFQTSSPSYLLIQSLELNARLIREHGQEIFKKWQKNIEEFHEEAGKISGLKLMLNENSDMTKLLMDMSEIGISGEELDSKLREKGIFTELYSDNFVLAMTGIGNSEEDYKNLLIALKEISEEHKLIGGARSKETEDVKTKSDHAGDICQSGNEKSPLNSTGKINPDMYLFNKKRNQRKIPVRGVKRHYSECSGKTCFTSIVPYPPGVPLIASGEEMDSESLEYAYKLKSSGRKVLGMSSEGIVYCE